MTIRTSSTTVTFRHPFFLGGFERTLPAGAYSVETDEELLEGLSFQSYRRIATLFHLPSTPADPGRTQTLSIDPNELDAALKRDEASTADGRQEKADCQAMDRAEDDGMIACPRETGEYDMPTEDSDSIQDTDSKADEEMATYGITRSTVDYFHYRGFRYMNLNDAVAQAKHQERRG